MRGFYTNPSRADDSFIPFKSAPTKTQKVVKTYYSKSAGDWIRNDVFVFSELTEVVGLTYLAPQGPAALSIANVGSIDGNKVTISLYCPAAFSSNTYTITAIGY